MRIVEPSRSRHGGRAIILTRNIAAAAVLLTVGMTAHAANFDYLEFDKFPGNLLPHWSGDSYYSHYPHIKVTSSNGENFDTVDQAAGIVFGASISWQVTEALGFHENEGSVKFTGQSFQFQSGNFYTGGNHEFKVDYLAPAIPYTPIAACNNELAARGADAIYWGFILTFQDAYQADAKYRYKRPLKWATVEDQASYPVAIICHGTQKPKPAKTPDYKPAIPSAGALATDEPFKVLSASLGIAPQYYNGECPAELDLPISVIANRKGTAVVRVESTFGWQSTPFNYETGIFSPVAGTWGAEGIEKLPVPTPKPIPDSGSGGVVNQGMDQMSVQQSGPEPPPGPTDPTPFDQSAEYKIDQDANVYQGALRLKVSDSTQTIYSLWKDFKVVCAPKKSAVAQGAPGAIQVQASVTDATIWVTPKPSQCGVQVDGEVETDHNNINVTLALENAAGDKTPTQIVKTTQTTHGYKGQFSAFFDMATSGDGIWVTPNQEGQAQWGLPGSSNTPSNQKTGSFKIVTSAPNHFESNVGGFEFTCVENTIATLPPVQVNPNLPGAQAVQGNAPPGATPRFGTKVPTPSQAVIATQPEGQDRGAVPRRGSVESTSPGGVPRFGAKVVPADRKSVSGVPPRRAEPVPTDQLSLNPEKIRSSGRDRTKGVQGLSPRPHTTAAACPPPNHSCKYNEGSSCWYNCQLDGGIEICDICVKSSGGGGGFGDEIDVLSWSWGETNEGTFAEINRGGRIIKGRVPEGGLPGVGVRRGAIPGARTLKGTGKPSGAGGGDGLDRVPTEIVSMDLRGDPPAANPNRMATRSGAARPAPTKGGHSSTPQRVTKADTAPAAKRVAPTAKPRRAGPAKVAISKLAASGRSNLDVWIQNAGQGPATGCTVEATLTRGARKVKKTANAGTVAPGATQKVTIATGAVLSAVKVSVRAKCDNATSVAKGL